MKTFDKMALNFFILRLVSCLRKFKLENQSLPKKTKTTSFVSIEKSSSEKLSGRFPGNVSETRSLVAVWCCLVCVFDYVLLLLKRNIFTTSLVFFLSTYILNYHIKTFFHQIHYHVHKFYEVCRNSQKSVVHNVSLGSSKLPSSCLRDFSENKERLFCWKD